MATKKKTSTTQASKPSESVRFIKAQLLDSKRYKDRHDLVMALLVDGKGYTIEEVDAKIENYLKGKVI